MKYLDGICRVNEDTSFGSIWKSYAPEDYRPGTTEYNTFSRDEFVGWSGIAPITMLIENIIGFRFFADINTVEFHLNNRQKSGLENMIFNDNNISVVCTKYEPFKKKTIIEVEAEKSFKLKVITKYLWDTVEIDVPKGKSTFKI